MADFTPEPDADESADGGGPIKTFLEHLEDFRWVLIKVAAALALAMLICLIGGNYVMAALKWPLTRAKVSYPGTNQVVAVSFGVKHLANFELTPEQENTFHLGTNRFVAVTVEPLTLGTNQILSWKVNPDPQAAAEPQHMRIELINLSPAGGFFVAFQVAFYGGKVFSAPGIIYFI